MKRIWENFVIWRYVSAGLRWGDYASYEFMTGLRFEGTGWWVSTMEYYSKEQRLERRLEYWTKRYVNIGYKRVPEDEWVQAGGYGKDISALLRIPHNGLKW